MIVLTTMSSAQGKRSADIENLYSLLKAKDSMIFNAAFSTCNTNEVENLLAKDFMFFHDNGYTNQTKAETLTEFLQNINHQVQPRSGAYRT